MNTIKLNGANAEKVAEMMGGVLIAEYTESDTAVIAGGDPTLLKQGAELVSS